MFRLGKPAVDAEPDPAAAAVSRQRRRRPAGPRSDPKLGLRAQFLRAGLTGLLAGVVAVVFNLVVLVAEQQRETLLKWSQDWPAGFLALPPLAAALAVFAVWLTQRFAPEAAGSGIPHVKAVLQHTAQLRWQRVLPVKLLGGLAALASGLSLGREGPTVQLGAATAQLTARLLHLPRRTHSQLIAAGAGAGLAAAFNTPLAGFIFVIEELRRELSPLTSSLALIAAIIADVVMRGALGQQPSFSTHAVQTPPLTVLPLFFIVGVIAAFFGLLFSRWLLGALKMTGSWTLRRRLWLAGGLAALISLAAWVWPGISGGGYANAQEILSGGLVPAGLPPQQVAPFVAWLLGVLGLRLILTVLSYATGAPGGIFAPMLAMGASLGMACGLLAHLLWPGDPRLPLAFAVVTMAALFSAVVRAPLTGIVLVLEMTANYELLLPLMVASMTAFLVAERLKYMPVYDALLELSQPMGSGKQDSTIWFDLVVEGGSDLEGRFIRELGWPEGCRIVTILRATRELTPKPSMMLQAGDHLRITADPGQQGFTQEVTAAARSAKQQA